MNSRNKHELELHRKYLNIINTFSKEQLGINQVEIEIFDSEKYPWIITSYIKDKDTKKEYEVTSTITEKMDEIEIMYIVAYGSKIDYYHERERKTVKDGKKYTLKHRVKLKKNGIEIQKADLIDEETNTVKDLKNHTIYHLYLDNEAIHTLSHLIDYIYPKKEVKQNIFTKKIV